MATVKYPHCEAKHENGIKCVVGTHPDSHFDGFHYARKWITVTDEHGTHGRLISYHWKD